jgi:hypothetical protein
LELLEGDQAVALGQVGRDLLDDVRAPSALPCLQAVDAGHQLLTVREPRLPRAS